jgi:hypothetical protein
VLANEKYTGRLIWGQKTFSRRPGTRQMVARRMPREQWHIQDRPELRIVSDAGWQQVQERHAYIRGTLPESTGRRLARGKNAALHSPHLLSGFAKCALCGGAIVVVTGGHGSSRYGCLRSWRNGVAACPNRLTVRAKIADPRVLDGLQAELLAPRTVQYVLDALAAALNSRIDARPKLLAGALAARDQVRQRLQRLVDAIESGVPAATLTAAVAERETELRRLDATIAELDAPLPQRLAVLPAWVRQQLEDVVAVLHLSVERTKTEFRHLRLHVTMQPISDVDRPFYRAIVESELPGLTGMHDLTAHGRSTVDRSRSATLRPTFDEISEGNSVCSTVDRSGLR